MGSGQKDKITGINYTFKSLESLNRTVIKPALVTMLLFYPHRKQQIPAGGSTGGTPSMWLGMVRISGMFAGSLTSE